MQLHPPPKEYPQDAACALLQLLSFFVQAVLAGEAVNAKIKSTINLQQQELDECGPMREPYMVRLGTKEEQALLETYKKGMHRTCESIGRLLVYGR